MQFLKRALPLLLIVSASAFAANIVTNPGFETGTFSGWTTAPASDGSAFGVSSSFPHTGTSAAFFGSTDLIDDAISQTLVTTPGTYIFSFWLDASQDVAGHFLAFWNGTQIFSTGAVPGGYQLYSFSETATGTSTVISFAGNTPPGFYFLDDVCVDSPGGVCASPTVIPEPSSLLLMTAGALALGLGRKLWA